MDLFVPLAALPAVAMDMDLEDRLANDLEISGCLRPDAALASAGAEMAVVARDLAQTFPETPRGRGIEVRAYSGLDADLRGPVLGFVAVLSVVGALVLLVAVSTSRPWASPCSRAATSTRAMLTAARGWRSSAVRRHSSPPSCPWWACSTDQRFVGGVVLLITTALLAADLPARRAALVPPIDSLRGD